MTDVLIAGAGPVGLTLANELARYGVSVRIIDKAAARTDKSKALVLWPRSLELLEHGGYVEPFLAAGNPATGAHLSDGSRTVAEVKLAGIDTRYPFALMIPQSETERGGARETVRADWLVGCDGAHSTVRHGLGFAFEGSTLQSRWALADGHVTGLEPQDHLHIFWHRDGILAFFPIDARPLARHRRPRRPPRARVDTPTRRCPRSRRWSPTAADRG